MPVKKKTKKTTKKSGSKTGKKAPAPPAAEFGAETVTFSLSIKANGLDVALGAAYLMTDRYYVSLGGDRKKNLTVTLMGREPLSSKQLKEAAELFQREIATQHVRWAIARANLPVREHVHQLAVAIAQQPPEPAADGPAEDELSSDQRSEIDALIAEVENEIKELKDSPAGKDPKNIAATWEEKYKAT